MARSEYGRRSPFEVDNARNEDANDLLTTYVPTQDFWRLLSAKNHIVLGARGSGKTALIKMLSHEILARMPDKHISSLVEKKQFIGIYVPTKLEWVSCLKNKPWKTEADIESAFQWRLNISACAAFLVTLKSCLQRYVPDELKRALVEFEIAKRLADAWKDPNGDVSLNSVSDLEEYLRDREYRKQQAEAFARAFPSEKPLAPVGISFDQELFSPLRRAIDIACAVLEFPESSKWFLCIDEAEFLDEIHHRIINSHLRAHPGRLFFKITTTPYFHHTLATNTKTPLSVGHDFEYVYIDQPQLSPLPAGERADMYFAKTLVNKRAERYQHAFNWDSLVHLLGTSQLLDQKPSDWAPGGRMFGLLEKYASKSTIDRANRLFGSPEFKDQISRKMHGALLLRDAVAKQKGSIELDVYDGLAMAIKCCESNPRRVIRLVNSFLLELGVSSDKKSFKKLSSNRQTGILRQFSTSILSRVQTEEGVGRNLYSFLCSIGDAMFDAAHQRPVTTDQYTSVRIDESIASDRWELVKHAVAQGLLVPNVNTNQLDQMPVKTGTFHLSYSLAPHFKLLPRRGKAIAISAAMANRRVQNKTTHQLSFFGN